MSSACENPQRSVAEWPRLENIDVKVIIKIIASSPSRLIRFCEGN